MFNEGETWDSFSDTLVSVFLIIITLLFIFVFLRQLRDLALRLYTIIVREYKHWRGMDTGQSGVDPNSSRHVLEMDKIRLPDWTCYKCLSVNSHHAVHCETCGGPGPLASPEGGSRGSSLGASNVDNNADSQAERQSVNNNSRTELSTEAMSPI